MRASATVIADSISPGGVRLTSVQARFGRIVLSEFNTHRTLSRNSASNRAIPVHKQIARIEADLFYPAAWPAEQRGMQGGDEVEMPDEAANTWRLASREALSHADDLVGLGVHKSVVNRLLEPFQWHTACVTATAWQNFFDQRCSPLAQPEIREVAEAIRDAMEDSKPELLDDGRWHTPYIQPEDWEAISVAVVSTSSPALDNEMTRMACRVSAARCARNSYLTQDGRRDIQEDLDLYGRLTSAQPIHWSPLEHVATPWAKNRQHHDFGWCQPLSFYDDEGRMVNVPTSHLPRVGNLLGWRSLRTEVEAKRGLVTFR